jgi:hypothetical protein
MGGAGFVTREIIRLEVTQRGRRGGFRHSRSFEVVTGEVIADWIAGYHR